VACRSRPQPGSLAHSRRLGDNAGMARDYSRARLQLQLALSSLDGIRPSGTLDWVSAAAPALTHAAVGAGHWAAGRRQRALAAWACAVGSGLVAWGLGTEAPTRAEAEKTSRHKRDLLRELGARGLGPEDSAAAGTQAPASQRSLNALSALASCSQVVFGVRSGLRHPQRLTAHVIASETYNTAFYILRAVRAVQQRRPRIAAGRALGAAGSLARLRAASAEPLPLTAASWQSRRAGGGKTSDAAGEQAAGDIDAGYGTALVTAEVATLSLQPAVDDDVLSGVAGQEADHGGRVVGRHLGVGGRAELWLDAGR
jgi:hypothetical protein